MLSPAQWDSVDEMSYPHGTSSHSRGMDEYVENMDPSWAGVEASPFVGVSHPYSTGGLPSAAILTPISLPDSSFANTRPSPVLSHHSQEYQYHCIGDPIAQHGLGISAPFPGDFPGPTASGFGYPHGEEVVDYGASQAVSSAQPQRTRRARRAPRPAPPVRETPVTILPHPEGLQRLEQERRQSQLLEAQQRDSHRSRAAGRGRRNPQAEEEDAFVERLRAQNLSWRIVAERFRERFNRDTSEARLQMRMSRRKKERDAMWDEDDVRLLITARDYWQNEKYKIIAQKLQELGAKRTYTPQQCEARLRALDAPQTREPSHVPAPRISDAQRRRRRATLKLSRRRAEAEGD